MSKCIQVKPLNGEKGNAVEKQKVEISRMLIIFLCQMHRFKKKTNSSGYKKKDCDQKRIYCKENQEKNKLNCHIFTHLL